jgi:hypothetical protein
MSRRQHTPRSAPSVLVLMTDTKSGPWVVRSLSRGGYRVVGSHVEGLLSGGRSLRCPQPLRYPSPVDRPDDFRAWVAQTARALDVDAVFPVSEDVTNVLAVHTPDLGRAVRIGPDKSQYAALCDKALLGHTCRAADVDHPLSFVVRPGEALPDVLPLPAVVKTGASGEAIDVALGVQITRTEADRDAAIRAVTDLGAEAVVQELVEGDRWNMHGARTRDGLAIFASSLEKDYPRGAGITALSHSVVAPPALLGAAERLLAHVGYLGPVSLNTIERGGRFYLHDVNLRIPASIGLTITAGLDVPRLAVDDALGRLRGPLPRVPRRTTYVGIDCEVPALVASLRRGSAESPRQVIADVIHAVRGGGRILIDPNPLDPFWLPTLALRNFVLKPARRVRTALSGRGVGPRVQDVHVVAVDPDPVAAAAGHLGRDAEVFENPERRVHGRAGHGQ